jgi:hypothetical protein
MMEGTTCQVFPLSVDRAIPLLFGSALKKWQHDLPRFQQQSFQIE